MPERIYYRHVQTGDRGYLQTDDGAAFIQLDQPRHDARRRFDPSEWELESNAAPLQANQLAQVTFAADVALCSVLGLRSKGQRWHELSQDQKRAWMEGGPPPHPARRLLFNTLSRTLRAITQ